MYDKKYFIGIDSDGTAFDSMTIKHKDSFIPAMIAVWNLDSVSQRAAEIEQKVNLYSKTRGVNRFPGQLMTFQKMKEEGLFDEDLSSLEAFVSSGRGFSTKALEEFATESGSDFMQKVVEWNRLSDELFAKNCENIQPFPYVKESLEKAIPNADIGVISSATKEGLETDWRGGGIAQYTSVILGKENGTKKEQLKTVTDGKYAAEHILMLGDALGDMEAAKSIGALFYPIIPGCEVESWKRFYEEALDRFFADSYAGEYEETLMKSFYASFDE